MLSCVSRFRSLSLSSAGLVLTTALVVGGCSGDMAPPGDLLTLQPTAPAILSEPVAPMMTSAPLAPAMFADASDSRIPNGPDAPMQNVLAYPVSARVDMNQMTSALPEGNLDQPIVTGIGTDNPQLTSTSGYPSNSPPDSMIIGSDPQFQDNRVDDNRVQMAGLMPRVSNPMSVPKWAGGMPAAEKACRNRLKRLGVTYRDLPAINSGKGCSIPHPIEVTGLSGGIEIKPAAKLNCQITDAFAQWVKNELAPAARLRYLSGVSSIRQLSSYSCRTMNSKRGAPMSEHASGNAIDVGKITLNNGQAIDVKKPGFFSFREKSLLKTVRNDSCKYFNTVLGPGSDVHHKDHFHFDLRARKAGYRHCD